MCIYIYITDSACALAEDGAGGVGFACAPHCFLHKFFFGFSLPPKIFLTFGEMGFSSYFDKLLRG